MSEIEDRRQRAREAFWDKIPGVTARGLDSAIEVATQVVITRDIADAFTHAESPSVGIRAMFEAAGFEVVTPGEEILTAPLDGTEVHFAAHNWALCGVGDLNPDKITVTWAEGDVTCSACMSQLI